MEGGGRNQLALTSCFSTVTRTDYLLQLYTVSSSKGRQYQARWTWIRCSNYQHCPLELVTNVNSQMPLHQVSPAINNLLEQTITGHRAITLEAMTGDPLILYDVTMFETKHTGTGDGLSNDS